MLTKCTVCGSRIIAGGETFLGRRFCSKDCLANFQVALTIELIPVEVVHHHINETFAAPCPECQRTGGVDLYSATTVSAFLIFFQIQSQQRVSCARCGRQNRLLAALHCLFFGWWGPKAALYNLFILPTNLLAALMIRTPSEPSAALTRFVMISLAETLVPQLLAAHASAEEESSQERGAESDGDAVPASV